MSEERNDYTPILKFEEHIQVPDDLARADSLGAELTIAESYNAHSYNVKFEQVSNFVNLVHRIPTMETASWYYSVVRRAKESLQDSARLLAFLEDRLRKPVELDYETPFSFRTGIKRQVRTSFALKRKSCETVERVEPKRAKKTQEKEPEPTKAPVEEKIAERDVTREVLKAKRRNEPKEVEPPKEVKQPESTSEHDVNSGYASDTEALVVTINSKPTLQTVQEEQQESESEYETETESEEGEEETMEVPTTPLEGVLPTSGRNTPVQDENTYIATPYFGETANQEQVDVVNSVPDEAQLAISMFQRLPKRLQESLSKGVGLGAQTAGASVSAPPLSIFS